MTSNQNERKFPEEGQKGVKENENKEENVIQFIYNKFNELKGQYEIIPKVKDERKTKELDDNGIKVKQRNKTLETFKIIKQLEEWIEKRINDILFDSDIDGWNITTSVFDQRLMNKENLIILIKDTEDNLFGGYVHSKIDNNCPNSFLFSLKIKGRIKGMKKLKIQNMQFIYSKEQMIVCFHLDIVEYLVVLVIFLFIKKIIKQIHIVIKRHLNIKE
ncbi:hypothetical protein ENU1_195090 [Entamoeba nuttalli P19]|uniref:TLDc domain-containing protein n=1 Tax=Entamoeba nuttalli (strain P19) TaxID=1076696 RepID=K2HNR1_ENTNP|nr:hypothetical protein ENU1_195090 [Entamoeba nuttalli P19]EKE37500.1 hypothetical protein ENU1_195090 [Entamoeba nuttalli P19]|eukprot:XP_008860165.1 hypothetical protein ENU1_195090 [Entamoeba nuttalli P19]